MNRLSIGLIPLEAADSVRTEHLRKICLGLPAPTVAIRAMLSSENTSENAFPATWSLREMSSLASPRSNGLSFQAVSKFKYPRCSDLSADSHSGAAAIVTMAFFPMACKAAWLSAKNFPIVSKSDLEVKRSRLSLSSDQQSC